jgi:hypothetical protein
MKPKTYAEKLKDPRWQRKRLETLQAAEYKCRICKDGESTLHVHHKFYARGRDIWDYPDFAFVVLCEECHEYAQSQTEFAHEMLAKFNLIEWVALAFNAGGDGQNFAQALESMCRFAHFSSIEEFQRGVKYANKTNANENNP